MLVVVMLCTVLPGGTMVVCFGADGHRAIEPVHEAAACGHTPRGDGDPARTGVQDAHAHAPCADVALDVPQPMTVRFDAAMMYDAPALVQPWLTPSTCDVADTRGHLPAAPPRVSDRLCLRSVVLVI